MGFVGSSHALDCDEVEPGKKYIADVSYRKNLFRVIRTTKQHDNKVFLAITPNPAWATMPIYKFSPDGSPTGYKCSELYEIPPVHPDHGNDIWPPVVRKKFVDFSTE